MSKEGFYRAAANFWGFIVIAVWMVGVPTLCKLAYKGASGVVSEASAVVYGAKPPDKDSDRRDDDNERSEVLAEYKPEEFEEMIALYNEHKSRKKRRG